MNRFGRDAGDVQLEFLGVVGELHQLAAEHALFGAPVGLDGEVMLDRPTPFAEPDGEERLRVVLFGAQGDAVIASSPLSQARQYHVWPSTGSTHSLKAMFTTISSGSSHSGRFFQPLASSKVP